MWGRTQNDKSNDLPRMLEQKVPNHYPPFSPPHPIARLDLILEQDEGFLDFEAYVVFNFTTIRLRKKRPEFILNPLPQTDVFFRIPWHSLLCRFFQ